MYIWPKPLKKHCKDTSPFSIRFATKDRRELRKSTATPEFGQGDIPLRSSLSKHRKRPLVGDLEFETLINSHWLVCKQNQLPV